MLSLNEFGVFLEVKVVGYQDDSITENPKVQEIYLASINNQRVIKCGINAKTYVPFGDEILGKFLKRIAIFAIKEYARQYADDFWYESIIQEHEIVDELSNKLGHYFL